MRTTGEDIFRTIDCSMKENNLPWINCVGICTDGAPAMVGPKKVLQFPQRSKIKIL